MSRLKAQKRFHSFDDGIVALRNDSTIFASFNCPSAGRRNSRAGPERSYDARDCPDAAPAVQNPDVSGGAALHEFWRVSRALPLLSLAPKGDGHPVLVLPGLVASDTSTRPLRSFLKSRGYAVSGWRQGRNLGLARRRAARDGRSGA